MRFNKGRYAEAVAYQSLPTFLKPEKRANFSTDLCADDVSILLPSFHIRIISKGKL